MFAIWFKGHCSSITPLASNPELIFAFATDRRRMIEK